jgi:hypothetical protein
MAVEEVAFTVAGAADFMGEEAPSTVQAVASTEAAGSAAEARSMADQGSAVVPDFEVGLAFVATAGADVVGAGTAGVEEVGVGEDGAGVGVSVGVGAGLIIGVGLDTDIPTRTAMGTILGPTMGLPTTRITTPTMTNNTLRLPLGAIATTATRIRCRPPILRTVATDPRALRLGIPACRLVYCRGTMFRPRALG